MKIFFQIVCFPFNLFVPLNIIKKNNTLWLNLCCGIITSQRDNISLEMELNPHASIELPDGMTLELLMLTLKPNDMSTEKNDQLKDKAEKAYNDFSERAEEKLKKADDELGELKEKAKEVWDKTKEKANQVKDKITEKIEEEKKEVLPTDEAGTKDFIGKATEKIQKEDND